MSPDDVQFMRGFVASRRWQFAKTMPENPHEYTVRKWVPDGEAAFERFVLLIRAHGRDERFRGRKYRYLDFDGFHLWTMGAPLGQTIIVNRKALPGTPEDANGTL